MRFIEEIRDGIMLIKCSNCNEEFEVETKQLELFVKNNSKCACGHTFDFADVKEETQFCEKIYNEDVGQRELEDYKKRLKSGFYDKYMKIKD